MPVIRISDDLKNKLDSVDSKSMDYAIKRLTGIEESITETLNFRKETAALAQEIITHVIPYSGQITQVSMHFPDGCNSLVEVRLYSVDLGGHIEYIIPSGNEEYIALDDVTQPFNINYPIKKGGLLKVEILNHDSVNSHTITVITVLKSLSFIKSL